jgi:PAS domain S-box-containing protein
MGRIKAHALFLKQLLMGLFQLKGNWGDFLMDRKPTYKQLEQRVKELEQEVFQNTRLEEQLKIFLLIFEQDSNAIGILDPDGNVEYANPKMLDAYKIHPVEFIGKNWRSFLSMNATIREHISEIRNTVVENGKMWKGEVSDRDSEGKNIWREVRIFPIKNENGEIIHSVYISEDITERKRTEDYLKESEEKYRELVEKIDEVVYRLDLSGRFTYISPAIKQAFGYKPDELIGILSSDFIHPDDLPQIMEEFQSAIEDKSEPSEYQVINKSNDVRWVRSYTRPIYKENKVIGLQGVFTDITERKQAEEGLFESEKQLRALAIRLSDVEETQRKRLAQELHDRVGQNLTALNINLNIMQGQLSAESTGKVATRLADSMTLVEETTEHIRDVVAELRPHVLDDYGLTAALRWYGERFSDRTGICTQVQEERLTHRLPPGIETSFFRIAQEAMINVAKHANASLVTLSLKEVDGLTRLTIADDGVGIESVDLTRREHSGWGHIIMKERAQAFGGQVLIESEPAKGTQVVVEVRR